MSAEEIVRLVFSFLGGGLVAGLIDWWRTARTERRNRQIEFLRSQLQNLYGPLQFFTSSNAQLFKLNSQFHEVLTHEYINKKWSEEYNTRENVSKDVSQTITIANSYIEQIVQNNEQILRILTDNYHLIDPADAEMFAQFIVHFTRLKTEIDESGRLKTPFLIYQQLGNISFMPSEFIDTVSKRFKEMKSKLERLLK